MTDPGTTTAAAAAAAVQPPTPFIAMGGPPGGGTAAAGGGAIVSPIHAGAPMVPAHLRYPGTPSAPAVPQMPPLGTPASAPTAAPTAPIAPAATRATAPTAQLSSPAIVESSQAGGGVGGPPSGGAIVHSQIATASGSGGTPAGATLGGQGGATAAAERVAAAQLTQVGQTAAAPQRPPRVSAGSVSPLPSAGPLGAVGGTWIEWAGKKLRLAKQSLHERMGSAQPTIDTEMQERVDMLRATQAAYRNVLRLATAFTTHLHGMVGAQRDLAAAFNELAMHQPELQEDFQHNYEAQRALYRNGSALLGALSFFVDNMETFVFTTIEDTLETWEEYQRVRLEFDTSRTELFHLRKTTVMPDGGRVAAAQRELEMRQDRFVKMREALATKLSLLEANKVRVMTKQLNLFRNAIHAYFTGNKADLDKILADAHLRPATLAGMETPKTHSWLDRLHEDVAGVIAPRSPALTPVATPAAAARPPAAAVATPTGGLPSMAATTPQPGPAGPNGPRPHTDI